MDNTIATPRRDTRLVWITQLVMNKSGKTELVCACNTIASHIEGIVL